MKSFLLKLILVFSITGSLFSLKNKAHASGDWVGNGASLSENLILLAFENLGYYLNVCSKDPTCADNSVELKEIILKIRDNLKKEKQLNTSMIKFLDNSPFFVIDGRTKIAVTGLNLGDTIYVNRDLLNDMSMMQAISILVHELGHHQGIKDHTLLDRAGAAVSNFSRFDSQFISIDPRIKNLGVQTVGPKEFFEFSTTISLVDSEKFLDLTQSLINLSQCPKVKNTQASKIAFNVWNTHWLKHFSGNPQLKGNIALKCLDHENNIFEWIGDEFTISINLFTNSNNQVVFNSEKIFIELKACNRDSRGECANLNTEQKNNLKRNRGEYYE